MESLELREEIKRGNVTYFLQTSFIADKKQIKSSFFRNGSVFDTSIRVFEEVPGRDRLRELAKDIHSSNKGRFRFILDIRDRMREQNEPVPHVKIAQALLARNLFIEAIAEAEIALGKGAVDSAPWIVKGESWYRLGESD